MCFRRAHCFLVSFVAGVYLFLRYIRVFILASTDAFGIDGETTKGPQFIKFIYDHLRTIR